MCSRWEASEAQRHRLIERVRALGAESQLRRPAPREFSPIEVMEHIALTEGLFAPYLGKPEPGARPKPNGVYRFAVRRMTAGGRLPTGGPVMPKGILEFDDVVRHWNESRSLLQPFLERTDVILRHPLFGRLGIDEVLDLHDAHVEYHLKRFPVVDS